MIAATYLGLTRYGVEKLINTGKLRLFTIAPIYRDEKPAKRIPTKDVAALLETGLPGADLRESRGAEAERSLSVS
jgi:hypothetical protein